MPTKRKRKGGKKSAAAKLPDPAPASVAQEPTANGNIPNGTATTPPVVKTTTPMTVDLLSDPAPGNVTQEPTTNGNIPNGIVTIPPVTKTITPMTVDLVRFDTTLSYEEIMARLEAEINKAGSDDIMSHLRRTNTQDEFKVVIQKFKPGEFLYFSEYPHQRLLQFKDGVKKPACHVYNFGNPMLAQSILAYNPLAGYSIPPRFLITENDDFTGCTVSYHRPSAVMSMVEGMNDPTLEAELKYLDGKIEALATRITAVQTANL